MQFQMKNMESDLIPSYLALNSIPGDWFESVLCSSRCVFILSLMGAFIGLIIFYLVGGRGKEEDSLRFYPPPSFIGLHVSGSSRDCSNKLNFGSIDSNQELDSKRISEVLRWKHSEILWDLRRFFGVYGIWGSLSETLDGRGGERRLSRCFEVGWDLCRASHLKENAALIPVEGIGWIGSGRRRKQKQEGKMTTTSRVVLFVYLQVRITQKKIDK